jgi:hypothetical protein
MEKAKMRAVRQSGLHKVETSSEGVKRCDYRDRETRLSYQETSATLPVKFSFLGVKYGEIYDQTARGR